MTELIESTLCQTCKAIFQAGAVKNESGEMQHHGLEALAARASKCHLCLTIFMSIDPEAYQAFRRGSMVESVGYAWISPIARDQARLKFRYVKPGMPGRGSAAAATEPSSSRMTPTSNSSKTSLSLSEADTTLVVELILMNPKCKSEQPTPGDFVRKKRKLVSDMIL